MGDKAADSLSRLIQSAFEKLDKAAGSAPCDGEEYEARDILPLLQDAASDLAVGQLIHVDQFRLFEAMSSTEVNDPKMDMGLGVSDVLLLPQALEMGVVPHDVALDLRQRIALMDRLIAMMVAYVCGHPVVQTVLSCLYLHENLRHTTDPIVRAFCLGVLRTVDVLRQTIMSGDIYQEEDFSATLHGLGLCEFVDEAATNKILVAAEQHCTFKQRNAKKTSEATENDEDGGDDVLWGALAVRFRFLRTFFKSHHAMKGGTDKAIAASLDNALKSLKIVLETHNAVFGAPDEGAPECYVDVIPSNVFQPDVAKRVPQPFVPRPMSLPTFVEAVELLLGVVEDYRVIASAASFCSNWPSMHRFFSRFSATHQQRVHLLSRSMLMVFMRKDRKVFGRPWREFVTNALLEYQIPPKVVNAEITAPLIDRISRVYLHHMCANRTRFQRKLPTVMYEWGLLQPEPPRFLSYWVQEFSFAPMIEFVKSGKELELYSDSEMPSVMWYLDYLYTRKLLLLSSKLQAVYRFQQATAKATPAAGGSGKKKKKAKKAKVKKVQPPAPTVLDQIDDVHRVVAHGVYRLQLSYERLREELGFGTPEPEFGSFELRFFQRFGAFQRIPQPAAAKHTAFLDDARVKNEDGTPQKPQEIAAKAVEFLTTGKDKAEKLMRAVQSGACKAYFDPEGVHSELKALMRVAVSNLVFLKLWERKGFDASAPLELSFASHPCYPTFAEGKQKEKRAET